MGQLRSGITNLESTCTELGGAFATLQKSSSDRVSGMTHHVAEGFNVLKLTLKEKFAKEKTTSAAQANRALKEVADVNVATVLKGIIQAKGDLKALIIKVNDELKDGTSKALTGVVAARTSASTLTKLAEKKKAKWLKSPKYKSKIGGYLTALEQVGADLVKLEKKILAMSTSKRDAAWVERCFPISVDMKVNEIEAASTAEFDSLMQTYEAAADTYVRGFRDEYKHMGNQLATFSKWAAEADAMDVEADAMK